MSETKAVIPAPAPQEQRVSKLDLSELSPQRRAYIQELRAQVMVQRGIREHCDWLAKTGGLPVTSEDGRKEQMSAGTAAIAIGVGTELGFPLNVALTKVTVINNRPAIYGDVALALIRKRGLVDPKKGGGLKWWLTGTPGQDDYASHVYAKRADTGEELETSFSIGDAKRAGLWGSRAWVKWGSLRMLRYRALGFLCRDLFSDVLLGVHLAEELLGEEAQNVTPPPEMTSPPSPESPAPVDPLWGGAATVDAELVESPPETGASEASTPPAAQPSAGAAETSEPPTSAEASPPVPTPQSAAQPVEPPAPPVPAPSPVDVDEQGRVVLERDAQGKPLVYAKANGKSKPPAPPAPTPETTKPASAPVTKPAASTTKPAPVAPAPAPLPTTNGDDDVARVKAAIAAARARLSKPKSDAPASAPAKLAPAPSGPVQGKVFEE